MKKKKGTLLYFFLATISLLISFFAAPAAFLVISKQAAHFTIIPPGKCLEILFHNPDAAKIFICCIGLVFFMGYFLIDPNGKEDYRADLVEVTPDIHIPKPIGQYQHGSAWFMSDKEFNRKYPIIKLDLKSPLIRYLTNEGLKEIRAIDDESSRLKTWLTDKYRLSDLYLKRSARLAGKIAGQDTEPFKKHGGGMVVGYRRHGRYEYINLVTDDSHSITVGATGSGKSRYIVIQTILCQILAGESVFASDIKGELYLYLVNTLKRLGVNVIVIDYRDMSKSMSYNFLQPIIDKLNDGDLNKACQLARDYANMISGKRAEHTDPMWHDGKIAVIAAAIIACTYDNMDHPENQNLTYVYEWITRMCAERPGGKGMLLTDYLEIVGEDHPANLILAQANVAPSKTRGSFYTSATTALSIFTDRQLYHICSSSDFKLTDITTKKTAMFVILPESKKTFYPLVSLMVSQLYDALDEYSNSVLGSGRLPRRVHFDLDEASNFSPFNDVDTMFTAARSKGIIFNLFLQSFSQLKEQYNENVCSIIRGNCTTQIYLKSTDDKDTNKPISESLGQYTTSSYSLSSSSSKYNNSGSSSMQLSSRSLLYPDELKQIKRPYMLVISDVRCKIKYSPDLSRWGFNTMLGLGDPKHNEKLRTYRQHKRPTLKDVDSPPSYTGLWVQNNFLNFKIKELKKQNRL